MVVWHKIEEGVEATAQVDLFNRDGSIWFNSDHFAMNWAGVMIPAEPGVSMGGLCCARGGVSRHNGGSQ